VGCYVCCWLSARGIEQVEVDVNAVIDLERLEKLFPVRPASWVEFRQRYGDIVEEADIGTVREDATNSLNTAAEPSDHIGLL
jgi:hypothetical protein